MNQAYFTFCCSGPGNSLSGSGGDRPRAAVKGVSESELMVYKRYCSFPQYSNSFSPEFSAEEQIFSVSLANAPLAKLVYSSISDDSDEKESSSHHFLAHSVYASPDKETNREGNYFSHLIYPTPNNWTVRNALEMWGSSFWVTSDSDKILPELPSVTEEDIPLGVVNQDTFIQFLQSSPEHPKKFLFLIKSLLSSAAASNKIVLTGLPEDMVFCLWGATRCLPSALWNNISFSTHEKPSLIFSYNVVNFLLPETMGSQDEAVFKELVQSQDVLFYSDNPHFPTSKLPYVPFADIIFDVCLNNSFETLDNFYNSIPANIITSGDLLLLYWTFLNQPNRITCQDIDKAITIPDLKNRAIDALMNSRRFTLDDQIKFFQFMDPPLQDFLLNKIISQNSIEQIRNNREYSQLLISALSPPKKHQNAEEENNPTIFQSLQSIFERILEYFKKLLSE